MKTICSWCGDLMKDGTLPVSHGCCAKCQVALLAEVIPAVEMRIEEAQRQR